MNLKLTRRRAAAIAALTLAGAFGVVAVAEATPGVNISSVVLASGNSDDTLKLDHANGPTNVIMKELTIQPGGTTGWHYHPGQVIAVVKQGTLTRIMGDDCMTVTAPQGSVVIEQAGPKHVHMGENLGTTPVVLDVTYLVPAGSPASVSVDAPACAG